MKKLLLLLSLLALPAVAAERSLPGAGTPRPFVLPPLSEGALSNGIPVKVAENHERPFVWITLSMRAGGYADPPGKEGLTAATFGLLDDAAGKYDGAALSKAVKKLGSNLGSGAGMDGAVLNMRALTRNVEPTLALLATILKEPHFSETDWAVLQSQMISDVAAARNDASSIADRVMNHLLMGNQYSGRLRTEASLKSITTAEIRSFYEQHTGPSQSLLLVGGDTTLASIQPLLEKYLGTWKNEPAALQRPESPKSPEGSVLYLVDKPGAAQSVLSAGRYVGQPSDPDYLSFLVANASVGGMFTSRINMNLREKNGYTYGARTSVGYDLAGTVWSATAPVATDVTAPALRELLAELNAAKGDRPLTPEEVGVAHDYLRSSFPLKFENPDFMLGQIGAIWRYQLPADWLSNYLGRLEQVDAGVAQLAWTRRLNAPMVLLVVGDESKVGEGLKSFGLPIVKLDVDGNPR